MSPEQATGDRAIDGRTDVYSLGAMLYEMLVGDPPHSASTSQAVIAKVLTERPRSVRASRPNVPPHVDAAIARALEKLAADRFATAKELRTHSTVRAPLWRPRHISRRLQMRTCRADRGHASWQRGDSSVSSPRGSAGNGLHPRAVDDGPVVRAELDLPPNTRINDVITGSTIAYRRRAT
jgi:serine/threonine protein kinase